jgi:ligand-binding sensor domain-containing protein
MPFTAGPSGLLDNSIFALASQRDMLWLGTLDGISRLNIRTLEWRTFNLHRNALGWRGVTDLLVAADGRLWAATQGGGLGYWDGNAWQFLRIDNSGIPSNIVDRLIETTPGILWVGLGFPTEPGGIVARFDGTNWQTFTPHNSGYIGYEPLALARDPAGRLWIGTAAGGLQLFDHP